jgi:hypothetical protein
MGGAFPGALVYTEVAAFGKDRGYSDPNDLLEFVTLVYELDAEYLLIQQEQQQLNTPAK